MKNIHALLKEIDIEIPEEKKADFDKALLENYKTVAEVEKITTARDNFKEQLETAKTQLKGMKFICCIFLWNNSQNLLLY